MMIVLKDLMMKREDLRIILMSATMETDELVRYWNLAGSAGKEGLASDDPIFIPAYISIPGRTFPVETFYLEDVLRMTGALEIARNLIDNDDVDSLDLDKRLENDEALHQYKNLHDIEQVDNDLILETIKFITQSCHGDGAILVFLPGK